MLRFADPLVTRHWLGSYQGEHLDAILGPIETWSMPEELHSWESAAAAQWVNFQRNSPTPQWKDNYALLGQAQLDALAQAARWQFIERLHDNFEQYHPRPLSTLDKSIRTEWFSRRLDEAQAWGCRANVVSLSGLNTACVGAQDSAKAPKGLIRIGWPVPRGPQTRTGNTYPADG